MGVEIECGTAADPQRDCLKNHAIVFLLPPYDGLKLLPQFDDAVGRTNATPENIRVEHRVASDDRAGIQHAVTTNVAAIADD